MNRIVSLIFSHKIPDSAKDPELQGKLWACRDVIFTRAMHALLRLFGNNFEFTKPKSSQEFLGNYKAQINSFAVFFAKQVELAGDDEYIFAADLIEAYHNFCKTEGLEVLKDTEIRKFLEAKSEIKKEKKRRNGKGNPISCYVGCRFKNLEKDLAVLRVI